jgi:hypothetical protein
MPIPSAAMIFEYLRPRSLASPQEVTEYLVLHQSAQHFRLEVEHRENLKAYCQWYDQVAAQNRATLAQMQGEMNLLAWFSGG